MYVAHVSRRQEERKGEKTGKAHSGPVVQRGRKMLANVDGMTNARNEPTVVGKMTLGKAGFAGKTVRRGGVSSVKGPIED